jgi:hypothetical protein
VFIPLEFCYLDFTTHQEIELFTSPMKRVKQTKNDQSYLAYPHSRQYPTAAEVSFNKKIIYDIDQEMEDVNEQIKALQLRLQLLRKRRNNHASYISPLRRLPQEIITNIFHICLEKCISFMVMTRICGTIRDVVNGMSDFWSRILLGFRYRYDIDSVRFSSLSN